MMWISGAPMPVWMRGRLALARALPQASISSGTARERAQIVGPSISCADQLDGLEIFGRRGGIAGLDDVDVQPRQLPGDHELLPAAQARAGGLLAVAQRGVEDGYFIGHCRRLYRRTGENSPPEARKRQKTGKISGVDSHTTGSLWVSQRLMMAW